MIVGGMDISTSHRNGDEHLAVIVGEESAIDSAVHDLDLSFPIHMSRLGGAKIKKRIISDLNLRRHDILAVCIRTNREDIIKKFLAEKKNKKSTRRIRNVVDYALLKRLNLTLANYLSRHKCSITDVPVQCDLDCNAIVGIMGLKRLLPGHAHSLADIVAWSNSNGILVEGAIEMDLKDWLVMIATKQLR